jgi:hypothetical protein
MIALVLGMVWENGFGQAQVFERLTYPVKVDGVGLKYPFVGGLNTPQFSTADLNQDGIQDLVVFDRTGNSLHTFLNNGTPNQEDYVYAPEYACYFPVMIDYALMRDYNNDGVADIFTASTAPGRAEIQAYKGYYENHILKFEPYLFTHPDCALCDPLYVYYPDQFLAGAWNNLAVNKGDIPAFDDINGDGDIDIVTFEASAGGHVWLLENQSVEKGLGLNEMRFEISTQCWGGFYESGAVECYCDLSPNTDSCSHYVVGAPDDRGNLHPGSTLMTFDQEGDGDKEIVLGDVSFSCLNYLHNGGSASDAWMVSQQIQFPENDVPVDLDVFPAAFYLDINNDGKKDMVVSPNNPSIGEDRKNVWFYENTATTGHQFELSQRDLLTNQMIDVGTVTHPAFADVNGDELTDIVVGTYGYFSPGLATNARLYLFLNVGTPFQPAFELVDKDWLGLSEFAPDDYDFAPNFGDIDGDGALDLMVGSNIGGVYCYRNQAAPDEPMDLQRDFNVMWVQMDVVGSVSTPFVYDMDQDGLMDLIVGERTGFVNYFHNTGDASEPVFPATPNIGKVGNIDCRTPNDAAGYCSPVIVQTPDGPILVVGTQAGHMEAYFISENLQDTFVPTDLMWGNIDVGARSHPAMADLDSDGVLEMVVGNQRGGLSMYRTTLVDCATAVNNPTGPEKALKISPNPVRDWARIEWPGKQGKWFVYNALGQLMNTGTLDLGMAVVDVKPWPAGVYFVEAVANGKRESGKLVVRK